MTEKFNRFIKSYPDLMLTPLWTDDAVFKLYHFLLYKASWKDSFWQGVKLHENDVLISQRAAAKQLHWSVHKYQRHIKDLQDLGVVSVRDCSKGSIITIRNFSDYIRFNAPKSVATTDTDGGYGDHTSVAMTDTKCGYGGNEGVAMVAPYIEEYRIKNSSSTTGTAAVLQMPDGFDQLWRSYPVDRRSRKPEAVAIYEEACRQGATLDSFLKALEAAKNSFSWLKENGQYIPSLVNWLTKEAWRDYITAPKDEEEEWITR